MDKLLSIIMPVYNSDKYLYDCIMSIVTQSFENFELLLIDDGSMDNSGYICDSFAAKDPRIRVWHNKNHGVSFSRNFGIKHACGKYLLFSDSDDKFKDGAFEKIVNQIKKNPMADLIIFGITVSKDDHNKEVCPQDEEYSLYGFGEVYIELYKKFLINPPFNKIYKSSIIDESVFFPENISLGEDLMFCNSFIRKCNKIVTYSQPLYIYLQRAEESLSTKYYDNLFEIYHMHYLDIDKTLSQIYPKWNINQHYDLYSIYLKYIKQSINIVFDKENKDTVVKKIKRIKYICSHPFTRECISVMDNKGLYDKMVEKKYSVGLLVYIYISKFKSFLMRMG